MKIIFFTAFHSISYENSPPNLDPGNYPISAEFSTHLLHNFSTCQHIKRMTLYDLSTLFFSACQRLASIAFPWIQQTSFHEYAFLEILNLTRSAFLHREAAPEPD